MLTDLISILIVIIAILWVLVLLSGGFRSGNGHQPGSGHIKQRLARGRNPFR